jgi:hypothetical protein
MTLPAGRLVLADPVRTRWGGRLAMAGIIMLAVVLVFLLGVTERSMLLAFVPFAALLAAYAIWRLPMRTLMLGLLAIGLLADNPASQPYEGRWRTWLSPIGDYLYDNLNNHLPLQALRFSGLDALIIILIALVAVRIAFGRTIDQRVRKVGIAAALPIGLAAMFLSLLWLEAWGLAHAGDFKNSLWQIQELLWLPVLTGLFAYALQGPRDFVPIARIIVGAACVKVALALYFKLVVSHRLGVQTAYATTHDDTVLLVTAIAICIAAYVHRPSHGHLVLVLAVVPWLLLGVAANDRRIAYVSLGGALFVLYLLLRGPVKRAITRVVLVGMPVFLMYLVAGRNHPTGIFMPAAKIMSVVLQKDASSGTRDIENYNLIVTLKQAPLLGSGFGHMYTEVSKAYDISKAFAQYRFIAHNSILWLWSIAGVAGFTLLWMFIPTTVYLAARSYRHARVPVERTAAASMIAAIIIWMVQAWGDMGTQNWPAVVMMSCLLALTAKLAVATGAWPTRVAFARRSRQAMRPMGAAEQYVPQPAP